MVSPEGLGASRLPSFARMACPGRSLVFAPLLSEAQRAVLHRILSAVLSTEGFGDLSAGTTRSFRRKDLTLDQVLFTPKTIALKTSRSKDPTWLKQKENTVEMITSEASQIKMRGDRGAIRQIRIPTKIFAQMKANIRGTDFALIYEYFVPLNNPHPLIGG